MGTSSQSSLLSIIQLSITPVILISGLGGLLITLTNRMARIVDRTRILAEQLRASTAAERVPVEHQMHVMWKRANLMRWSVTLAGGSMLVACMLIGLIFLGALLERELAVAMMVFFSFSLSLLIASLILFLRDLFISLVALDLEVRRALNSTPAGPSP